jgi:MFS family permease
MPQVRVPQVHIPQVLREATFARYLSAVLVSSLGGGMATVALAFAMLDLGGVTDLGIVILAREIPLVIFVLLGGVLADRWRRRTILVSADLIRAASQGATAFLLFTGHADVLLIAALQAVFGLAGAFSRPATSGLVREAVSDARLQEANALLGLSRSVMSIAGPAIGALIVAAGSPAAALGIDALTFLVSAVLLFSMRLPGVVRAATASLMSEMRAGWNEFISRRWAVIMIASFGLFQLTYFPAMFVLGPAVAKVELGGPTAWGAILAVESIGAVLGGLVAYRIKVHRPLIATNLVVLPSGLLLIGLAVPLPLFALVALGGAVGLGFSLGGTIWETTLQRNVPEHALSRISSYDWFGSVALNPIGYLFIGPLAEAIGTPTALLASGALNMAVCFLVLLAPSVRGITMRGDAPSPGTPAGPVAATQADMVLASDELD